MMMQKHIYGTKIYSVQHGGGYGTRHNHTTEIFERDCSDAFLTWGWKKHKEKDKPLPPLQFINLKIPYSKKSKKILFVRTEKSKRNLINSPFRDIDRHAYHQNALLFLSSLHSKFSNNMYVKNHSITTNTFDQNLHYEFSKFKKCNNTLLGNLDDKFKFFIVDHIGTTLFQLIYFKLPFILFIDSNIFHLQEWCKPHFRILFNAGVAFQNFKDASEFLNVNFDLVDEWWSQKSIQNALDHFSSTFCIHSKNWTSDWNKALLS
jgi:putative transferase (TIGR04331 family)